jgi:hypothetical protein
MSASPQTLSRTVVSRLSAIKIKLQLTSSQLAAQLHITDEQLLSITVFGNTPNNILSRRIAQLEQEHQVEANPQPSFTSNGQVSPQPSIDRAYWAKHAIDREYMGRFFAMTNITEEALCRCLNLSKGSTRHWANRSTASAKNATLMRYVATYWTEHSELPIRTIKSLPEYWDRGPSSGEWLRDFVKTFSLTYAAAGTLFGLSAEVIGRYCRNQNPISDKMANHLRKTISAYLFKTELPLPSVAPSLSKSKTPLAFEKLGIPAPRPVDLADAGINRMLSPQEPLEEAANKLQRMQLSTNIEQEVFRRYQLISTHLDIRTSALTREAIIDVVAKHWQDYMTDSPPIEFTMPLTPDGVDAPTLEESVAGPKRPSWTAINRGIAAALSALIVGIALGYLLFR